MLSGIAIKLVEILSLRMFFSFRHLKKTFNRISDTSVENLILSKPEAVYFFFLAMRFYSHEMKITEIMIWN